MLIKEDNKKQCGAAVYLSLQGTARDAVRGIETKVLQTEQGVDELFKLLDAVYLRDDATKAYCAFKDFVEYRRSSGETFSIFIVEFEKRYREVEKHKMVLPTGAKAYFLLH